MQRKVRKEMQQKEVSSQKENDEKSRRERSGCVGRGIGAVRTVCHMINIVESAIVMMS